MQVVSLIAITLELPKTELVLYLASDWVSACLTTSSVSAVAAQVTRLGAVN